MELGVSTVHVCRHVQRQQPSDGAGVAAIQRLCWADCPQWRIWGQQLTLAVGREPGWGCRLEHHVTWTSESVAERESRETQRKAAGPLTMYAPSLACHFCPILLVKKVTKANPDSRGVDQIGW